MERDQAVRLMQDLLKRMVEVDGSDLFITAGFPPAIKIDGSIHRAVQGQRVCPAGQRRRGAANHQYRDSPA